MSQAPIAIVGGGAWGTALAAHLGRHGRPVRLWIRESELVSRMLERRDNPVYLPGIDIPASVAPTGDLPSSVEGVPLIVVAVPTPYARGIYSEISGRLAGGTALVVATKGIEEGTLLLPTQVAAACLPSGIAIAAISGPSFAEEVARGMPTAIVVASPDPALSRRVQEALASDSLRLYTNSDVVGVQIAGALKNVVAIAAGIVDGLGYGHNTVAALVTRGLAEMRRLGVALGGSSETFSGLAALGDLVLTCTGGPSRNRQVGQALGRGERLEDVVARMRHVAEGIRTARSARDLAARTGVDMPIVEEVHRILHEDGSPREAVRRLMTRPLTSESAPDAELQA